MLMSETSSINGCREKTLSCNDSSSEHGCDGTDITMSVVSPRQCVHLLCNSASTGQEDLMQSSKKKTFRGPGI